VTDHFDLSGRTVVVTGGSRGIGRAIAIGMAEAGADVVPTSRTEADVAEVVEAVRERGARSFVHPVDVTDEAAAGELFERATDELDGLDVLVNNAGINPDEAIGRPADVEATAFDHTVEVNLNGTYRCSRAASAYLHDGGGGCVVNVASMEGVVGFDHQHPYVASKHGVVGLTKSLALDWAPDVRVNALAPGYVDTDMTESLQDIDSLHESMLERIPLDRMAEPPEMVGPAIFLASPAAGYVTGTVLLADGGWAAQ